jgi:hypothetical protein
MGVMYEEGRAVARNLERTRLFSAPARAAAATTRNVFSPANG